MSENKIVDTNTEKSPKKKFSFKMLKGKKIRNMAILRKGGYSLAITAAVLAVVILFNVLVGALSQRFMLEFDMSGQNISNMTKENVDYIKDIDKEVSIIFCAKAEEYVDAMGYYAQNYYGITDDSSSYFKQTLKLIDKYPSYNKNITLEYVDTQSTEFTEIASKYSKDNLAYGDIIVSTGSDENHRYKILSFNDIYNVEEDDTYAQYGYTFTNISGNNIETAVTGAITFVTNENVKMAALIAGHTKYDYTETYQTLLKTNNYQIDVLSENMITSLDSKYDVLIVVAPHVDFLPSEIEIMSKFLDNDGKLQKGLIFVADITAPYLTNFYSFLADWGINIGQGILFETNSQNYMPDDPTTLGSYPQSKENDITENMELCITGNNVPITAGFESEGNVVVTSLITTPNSVVAAPEGTAKTWTGAEDYEKKSFATVIQSKTIGHDSEDEEIGSYIMAYSSVEFIYSDYSELATASNKDIILAGTQRAANAEDTGISFVPKTIINESYTDLITDSSAKTVRVIFIFVLPIAIVVAGIYVFIRRKNA